MKRFVYGLVWMLSSAIVLTLLPKIIGTVLAALAITFLAVLYVEEIEELISKIRRRLPF